MLKVKLPALGIYCNKLCREIINLRAANDSLNLYTVQHATRMMCVETIDSYVTDLQKCAESLKDWFANPVYGGDGGTSISYTFDKLQNISNEINDLANQYLDENETDVRDIIDTETMLDLVDRLQFLLLFCELHKCSSAVTILQGNVIKLLDGCIKNVVVYAEGYILGQDKADIYDPDPWDGRDELLKKFGACDEPLKSDEVPPPSVFLKFIKHDQQVVFSASEKQQIADEKARQEAAAKEKAALDAEIEYARIKLKEIKERSEELGLMWHILSPKDHETCQAIERMYYAAIALTKDQTITAALKAIDTVLKTREPYYFSTPLPCASALLVNAISDNKLQVITMDSHEEVLPNANTAETPMDKSELVMVCLR